MNSPSIIVVMAGWAAEAARRLGLSRRAIINRLPGYMVSPIMRYAQATKASGTSVPSSEAVAEVVSRLAEVDAGVTHLALAELLAKAELLTESTLDRYLRQLFKARQLRAFELLVGAESLGHADLRLFHRLLLEHYQGVVRTSPQAVSELYDRVVGNPVLCRRIADVAVTHFVRSGARRSLVEFVTSGRTSEIRALTPNTCLGCAQFLLKSGDDESARRLIHTYLKGCRLDVKLHFLEPLHELFEGRLDDLGLPSADNWRRLLVLLETSYVPFDRIDRRVFFNAVVEPLRGIPEGERDLMSMRFDASQADRLISVIRNSIATRSPFSLVRLGDGESYAYPSPASECADVSVFTDDEMARERHWWHSHPSQTDRQAIKDGVRAAVRNADVLGVPSVFRIIRDMGAPGTPFCGNRARRGLACVLSALGGEIPLERAIFTEERCNQVAFSKDALEGLASIATKLLVVSCWSREQLGFLPGVEVECIRIAPATKVKDAMDRNSPDASLHESFREVSDRIAAAAGPGTLVLVGGGIIGKLFVDRARAAGAVALDVGAILDYIAGFQTRGISDIV